VQSPFSTFAGLTSIVILQEKRAVSASHLEKGRGVLYNEIEDVGCSAFYAADENGRAREAVQVLGGFSSGRL
ncbi:MAG: hypothetical protein Q4E18_05190, partial [Clostridia bacterium]|nr:hypothetical protein [Clostridia bacterium]